MRLPVGEAFLKNASALALALALWGSPARALEAYDSGAAPSGSNFAALARVGTLPPIPPGGAAETGSAPVADIGSKKTVAASSNETPCFRRFASAFSSLHSNRTRVLHPFSV